MTVQNICSIKIYIFLIYEKASKSKFKKFTEEIWGTTQNNSKLYLGLIRESFEGFILSFLFILSFIFAS